MTPYMQFSRRWSRCRRCECDVFVYRYLPESHLSVCLSHSVYVCGRLRGGAVPGWTSIRQERVQPCVTMTPLYTHLCRTLQRHHRRAYAVIYSPSISSSFVSTRPTVDLDSRVVTARQRLPSPNYCQPNLSRPAQNVGARAAKLYSRQVFFSAVADRPIDRSLRL